MKKLNLKSVDLDRIERAYLAALRIAILGVATLCLIGAVFFGVNALWRVFVSTEVEPRPVEVTGAQIAAELKKATPEQGGRDQRDQIPANVRQTHARWARDIFPAYYAVYRNASQGYKKPEDETLSAQQLMEALGYDLESYAAAVPKTAWFINNSGYQQQALAAVTAAMRDPAVVSQLREYKAAQKTARSCSTTYQRRRVWDSYSTACYGWWQYPQGCEVTRSVPVETCVAAYPQGIVSPRVAFGRADEEFFRLWTQQAEQVAAEAQATRDGREATRAQIGPNLLLALQILAAFLVVMFFFLMVAIERHLRAGAKLPAVNTPDDSPPTEAPPELTDPDAGPPPSETPDNTPRWARRR